jgi:hypothetical protein
MTYVRGQLRGRLTVRLARPPALAASHQRPQCGFSSTVEGNLLTYDEQVAKLRLIVETAHEVWG